MSDAKLEPECKFCKSMGFGGCEMCTDSRSELKRLKSELERVKGENKHLKERLSKALSAIHREHDIACPAIDVFCDCSFCEAWRQEQEAPE